MPYRRRAVSQLPFPFRQILLLQFVFDAHTIFYLARPTPKRNRTISLNAKRKKILKTGKKYKNTPTPTRKRRRLGKTIAAISQEQQHQLPQPPNNNVSNVAKAIIPAIS